jgi:hypothetical protein
MDWLATEFWKPKRDQEMGRPRKYSNKLALAVCARIEDGVGLRKICAEEGMPSVRTLYRWLESDTEFRALYARARKIQADVFADEIVAVAYAPLVGKKIRQTKDGTFQEVGDCVERSKLIVDALKWAASKLAPDKYGDKGTTTPPPWMNPQLHALVDALNAGPVDNVPVDSVSTDGASESGK